MSDRGAAAVDGSKIDEIRHNLAVAEHDLEAVPFTPPEVVIRWVKPLAAMARALLDELDRMVAAASSSPVQAPGGGRPVDLALVDCLVLPDAECDHAGCRQLAEAEAELAKLKEHTLANNPALRQLHGLAVAYHDAVEAYTAVTGGGTLSTTLAWVIRQGYLVPATQVNAELRAENERLRAALAGKERYEEEAERQFSEAATEWGQITAERDEARSQLAEARGKIRAVELLHVWTNEDGKRFVFVDDLAPALGISS